MDAAQPTPQLVKDSRCLTGPNLFFQQTGTVLDVSLPEVAAEQVIALWREQVQDLLDAVGWSESAPHVRGYDGGASLGFTAPTDVLYAATELNTTAWQAALAQLDGKEFDREAAVAKLTERLAKEHNPELLRLKDAAERRGVSFFHDGDRATVGLGRGSQSWEVKQLPDPEQVDWSAIHDVPTVMVTGTNGKSSSIRILAQLVKSAGLIPGLNSTENVQVGEVVLDTGDYSGPGGARMMLKDQRTEIGLLEVARGGLLRRGLGLSRTNAVLITNVTPEHLREYGIDCVGDLIAAKFVVTRALEEDGVLVLNADDAGLVEHAHTHPHPATLCWFSQNPDNPVLREHLAQGGRGCFTNNGQLIYAVGDQRQALLAVNDIPCTMQGAAIHNISNCLGVVGLAKALNFKTDTVIQGLTSFRSDASDNPGRGNLLDVGGVQVLIDYAHNVHGFEALTHLAKHLSAKRRLVMFGQVGSHTHAEICAMTESVARLKPERVVITEILGHLRGSQPGEIPEVIHQELRRQGIPEQVISKSIDGLEGTKIAMQWAESGDLLILILVTKREAVMEFLLSYPP